VMILRGIILFRRGGTRDIDGFNKWLDRALAKQTMTQGSLLLYPEGTRNTRPESLTLKRGMLKYAWSRKLKFQVIITSGKENVLNEKKWHAALDQTCCVGYSELLDSADYQDSFDNFMAALQKVWDAKWDEVYGTAARYHQEGTPLPDFVIDDPVAFSYSTTMRVGQCLVTFGSIGLLGAMLKGGYNLVVVSLLNSFFSFLSFSSGTATTMIPTCSWSSLGKYFYLPVAIWVCWRAGATPNKVAAVPRGHGSTGSGKTH